MINVVLSGGHRLLLDGLKCILDALSEESGIVVSGVARSFDELKKIYSDDAPSVLVIDTEFQDESRNCLDFYAEILRKNRNAKIVIFSQNDNEYFIQLAYEMGVLAYVRKDEDEKVLIAAIKSVHDGKQYISPAIAQVLAKNVTSSSTVLKLPEKQKRVFVMLADGYSVQEIADKLGVVPRTISSTIKELKEILGLHNEVDFTKLAIQYGMIDLKIIDRKSK